MAGEDIWVVSPVFNERQNVNEFVTQVRTICEPLPYAFHLCFVNDGSDRETTSILDALADSQPGISVLHLSRNFGHQAAISAGLETAHQQKAAAVITMDSDLQHPPELIPALIDHWQAGSEVVYTVRDDCLRTSLLKRWTSRIFYRLMNTLSDTRVPTGAADFRLLDRVALTALVALPERTRFLRGMAVWIGFRQVGIRYVSAPRFSGEPKFTWLRMFRLGIDGLVSMTTIPLRVALFTGSLISLLSSAYLGYIICARFFTTRALPGWSSIMVAILLLNGLILTTLGFIGLYLEKIFVEVKGRPVFIVRERRGEIAQETDVIPPTPPSSGTQG